MVRRDEEDRPLRWLHGEVKSPPFSMFARLEAGFLLRHVNETARMRLKEYDNP